jgi:deazaflavin-dependent oxidoreductase (nitroreductase family)
MTGAQKRPFLPPRWFVRLAWVVHRAILRVTGRRRGLWKPEPGKWGTLELHSRGRRSGQERVAILGYYEDGDDLVTLAMNGWAAPEPAWWLNLQADPDATIRLADGSHRPIRAHAAAGAERDRLWARWSEFGDDYEAYAAMRPSETAVVVLSPRAD